MYEEAGVSFGGYKVIGIRELFKDGPNVSLHDGRGGFACEGQDVVGG